MSHDVADHASQHIDERLPALVEALTGVAGGPITSWSCEPVDHRVENMTTRSLDRYVGASADGTEWSVIAKTLHPASQCPAFAFVPEEHRAETLDALNWLDEPRIYRSRLRAELPTALRMPAAVVVDDADDRITIWLEDVADLAPWDLDRYARTATVLGRMSGRWIGDRASRELGIGHRDVGVMFFGKVTNLDLVIQADDGFWSGSAVARVVDATHRADLESLAARMPEMIERLGTLPVGMCHGDATPANFREPGDGTVVALDWSYGHVGALGSDLGQLLVGRYESGDADIDDIHDIATVILDGYCAGLHEEGVAVDAGQIEQAWATHLAIRSVFSALVLDHRPDLADDALVDLLRRRAAVARFGIDLASRYAVLE